jgi:Fe-S cluster assembly iron-binding protein IscA
MLNVTKKAAALLAAAREAEGGSPSAGIRIRHGTSREQSGSGTVAIGFTVSDEPQPDDEQFEQNGLRFFVEEALIEPLDGRTLDVSDVGDGPQLVFR